MKTLSLLLFLVAAGCRGPSLHITRVGDTASAVYKGAPLSRKALVGLKLLMKTNGDIEVSVNKLNVDDASGVGDLVSKATEGAVRGALTAKQ